MIFSASLKKPLFHSKISFYEKTIKEVFSRADIRINGSRPWDMQVHDPSVYHILLKNGSLGLGESYMDSLWDCEQLDELLFRALRADLENEAPKSLKLAVYLLRSKLFNLQTEKRAWEVGRKHYDAGNDLYEAMLDKRMMYSCAYWEKAGTLDEAQEQKLDLICRKLKLQPGLSVLDIGCGWGGFAAYAAEKYQVEVTGITISKEQAKLARERCQNLPVEIRVQDYRELDEQFDRVVSIGMFEHVGYKNYDTYMQVVKRALKEKGLFLLHCIGGNSSVTATDPWINKYIFPNGMMPSIAQIGRSAEQKFILEDWQNFGVFYDRTLMEWLKRFKNAWNALKDRYDDRFYRMWTYYLCASAASFRAKKTSLWQLVFSQPSNLDYYQSIR